MSRVPGSRAPMWVTAYIGAVVGACVGLWVVALAVWGLPTQWQTLLVLLVAGVASWRVRATGLGGGLQISVTSIVLVTAAAMLSPAGAGLVGLTVGAPGRGVLWRHRVFNTAMASLLGTLGGVVYRVAGGSPRPREMPTELGWDVVGQILTPLVLADLVICLVNGLLVSGVIRVSEGSHMLPRLRRMLATTGPLYLAYGIIAFLWVLLWGPAQVGWFSGVLIAAPLGVAGWAMVQHGEEQRSHQRTLELFTAVLDARHHDGRRHSIEVGRLSGLIAETMGLSPELAGDVARAGMLHDLGRVGEPDEVFNSCELVTQSDLAALRRHPGQGVEMLRGIRFMAGSLDGIRHHHERWDGLGYPDRLAGQDIPLAARIIAAADLMDYLTSPGGAALPVADALVVARRRAGTHLDPSVVRALGHAVTRHSWTPEPPGADDDVPASRSHDDPRVCDAVAAIIARGTAPRVARTPRVARP